MNKLKCAVLMLMTVVAAPVLAVGDAEAGKGKAAVCAACHGQDGNSPGGDFPSLAGQGAKYTLKQLRDYKSGARVNGIMQAQVAGLSDQDLADLAAFYAGQTAKGGSANPEYVELGERLYRGGNPDSGLAACAGCHSPTGEGLEAASFPALAGQHASYTETQLRAFRASGRGDLGAPAYRANDVEGDGLGMMQAVAAKMSDVEIRAVASYISGLGK
ncbi:MAG: cytochrome c4 [Gammaproteobacteria bacterium HGW-Gammaproteobacteria-14]|nr:MAG: cytochrome c4 [Gammaproteobacteria bacterium HGW-Gammaproteobacteria-14]